MPGLFRGELGETILLVPPDGSLAARKLLIIGLGDSENFTPHRMELIGSIAYRESNRLGIAHPFFAPTLLDGGVTKFATGQVAERFYAGFLRAARTEKILKEAGASSGMVIQDLTFLAGPTHAADTQQGLERLLAIPPN
jgi:Cytosol aminopeptidase family, N-terminal domain